MPNCESRIFSVDTWPRRNMWRWLLAASCSVIMAANSGCQQKSAPSAELPDAAPSVTFSRDVAPIVFQKCSSCHHPGESAPFSLLTYDDVRRRARQIVDVTQKRFMPPWLPTEGHGDFVGQRRLTDRELEILQAMGRMQELRPASSRKHHQHPYLPTVGKRELPIWFWKVPPIRSRAKSVMCSATL